MEKILKFIGIGFVAIAIILLLIVRYTYGSKYVAKIDRLPEGTRIILVDTRDKPSQSAFSNQAPLNLGWPIPQEYQGYAANFHWWLMNLQHSYRTGQITREEKPTLAVVFILRAEKVPALASFAGKVQMVSITSSGNGPEIATVELKNDEYIARYEHILGPTVKEGTEVQKGDSIGTIAYTPTTMFPKENTGPWKKMDVIGAFTFKFSLFKIIDGGDREPVWISTESFGQ